MTPFFKTMCNFFSLYLVCVVSTYFLPAIINQVVFVAVLVLFYRGKKNYFWLAFYFFLVDPPGALFPLNDYNYGLPMFNLLPGSGRLVYFSELFIFTALLKMWKK